MKTRILTSLSALTLVTTMAQAQPTNEWIPATSNQTGREYPKVNSEGRVRARIAAPQAKSVELDISGVRFPMTNDGTGVWTGDSTPQDEGNHYYGLVIDGAQVPDPGSTFIYGSGSWRNSVEIPAADQEFYALKNVPHGQLHSCLYTSKDGSTRHSVVYTPPDYEKNPSKRFPVLYLHHGMNENETGWGSQGRAGLIMDNLIAQGKAKPFIIVMENGGISNMSGGPGRPGGGRGMFDFGAYERILLDEVIPYVDANFRTITDQPHRAMAGLSMGGMQTRRIAPAHLDTFSYIGIFSGGSIKTNEIADLAAFKQKVKVVFVSYGSKELNTGRGMFGDSARENMEALKQAGINSVYYESPKTAHEWQTWRRSLHEFAPLLFQD